MKIINYTFSTVTSHEPGGMGRAELAQAQKQDGSQAGWGSAGRTKMTRAERQDRDKAAIHSLLALPIPTTGGQEPGRTERARGSRLARAKWLDSGKTGWAGGTRITRAHHQDRDKAVLHSLPPLPTSTSGRQEPRGTGRARGSRLARANGGRTRMTRAEKQDRDKAAIHSLSSLPRRTQGEQGPGGMGRAGRSTLAQAQKQDGSEAGKGRVGETRMTRDHVKYQTKRHIDQPNPAPAPSQMAHRLEGPAPKSSSGHKLSSKFQNHWLVGKTKFLFKLN
ncbi:hypothetical protein BYT27DRAFT_7192246 [Phlegmacium glaucopus]|nr:hypothetical protein BYT27DRAFT_7192246 [Phlegmacium glaucopus]